MLSYCQLLPVPRHHILSRRTGRGVVARLRAAGFRKAAGAGEEGAAPSKGARLRQRRRLIRRDLRRCERPFAFDKHWSRNHPIDSGDVPAMPRLPHANLCFQEGLDWPKESSDAASPFARAVLIYVSCIMMAPAAHCGA